MTCDVSSMAMFMLDSVRQCDAMLPPSVMILDTWTLYDTQTKDARGAVQVAKKGCGQGRLWLRRHQAQPRPSWHYHNVQCSMRTAYPG